MKRAIVVLLVVCVAIGLMGCSQTVSSTQSTPKIPRASTATVVKVPTPTIVNVEIEVVRLKLIFNSIGTPEVIAQIRNNGNVAVDAFDFYVECTDAYGEIVKGYGTEKYASCTYQETAINPGKTSSSDIAWPLYGFDTAKKVKVAIYKYHTTDGKTIKIPENQYVWVSM